MITRWRGKRGIVASAVFALNLAFAAAQPTSAMEAHRLSGAGLVRRWNQIAIDASGLDHTPVAPGENRVFGEQLGPGRAARAMAIVHIAIYDAINAISGQCRTYCPLHPSPPASMDAAIVQAARDSLAALFPSQASRFDSFAVNDLNAIPPEKGNAKARGIAVGHIAAEAILGLRATDGSEIPEPHVNIDFIPSLLPGMWRQDPVSLLGLAMGAHWGEVQPFVLASPSQFRAPVPPALTSPEYTAAYDEVKEIGGDGIGTPTSRSAEQTEIGIFWAYDGTPNLCAPPRLYNQIAVHIADLMGTSSDAEQFSRLLALVNTAMADAGIAIWESKYFYQYWRPITGIRESDPGTGPTGLGDSNPDTAGDPEWTPLGAPASNLVAVNFTPPFPAYPSGHAGFGGALFQILRNFYGTDNIPFSFMSDEFDGITKDHSGTVRPVVIRHFATLSQAEEENGQSRIYLGIHWRFDKTEGIAQGRKVGDWVFEHAFMPTHNK